MALQRSENVNPLVRQIETANQFMQLWRALMPDLEPPDASTLLNWVGTYLEKEVHRGINRAAFKVRKLRGTATAMTANDAERYASSVMRHESEKYEWREYSLRERTTN